MSDLKSRVMAEIARTPSLTRAESRERALRVLGGSLLLTLVAFFVLGGVVRGPRAPQLVAFTVASAAAIATTATSLALGGGSMLGRPARTLAFGAVLSVVGLFGVVGLASAMWPSAEEVPRSLDLGCGALTVTQAALPMAALLWWRRAPGVVRPALTGAVLGLSAGAWSAALAYLRCPHATAAHGALAHATPSLLLMMVGAAAGASLLRLR